MSESILDRPSDKPSEEEIQEAWKICWDMKRAGTSLLQRRMRIGYAKAYRIVDTLEQRGIVEMFDSRHPRRVLIAPNQSNKVDKEKHE